MWRHRHVAIAVAPYGVDISYSCVRARSAGAHTAISIGYTYSNIWRFLLYGAIAIWRFLLYGTIWRFLLMAASPYGEFCLMAPFTKRHHKHDWTKMPQQIKSSSRRGAINFRHMAPFSPRPTSTHHIVPLHIATTALATNTTIKHVFYTTFHKNTYFCVDVCCMGCFFCNVYVFMDAIHCFRNLSFSNPVSLYSGGPRGNGRRFSARSLMT